MAAKKKLFAWSDNDYSISALNTRTDKELRKEYTRLRDIAQKRVARMNNSVYRNNEWFQQFRKGFAKLRDMPKTSKRLLYELNALHRFLSSPLSTLKGQKNAREKMARLTLAEHGYNIASSDEFFNLFTQFMSEVKSVYETLRLPSSEIAEFFEDAMSKDKKVGKKDLLKAFFDWLKKEKNIDYASKI